VPDLGEQPRGTADEGGEEPPQEANVAEHASSSRPTEPPWPREQAPVTSPPVHPPGGAGTAGTPGYGFPPGGGPPAAPWPGWGSWTPAGSPQPSWAGPPGPPGKLAHVLKNAAIAWLVAALLAAAVVGLSVALATRSSTPVVAPFGPPGSSIVGPGIFGGRFGHVAVIGTIARVEAHSFTVTALSGETVTVKEQASTLYDQGATKASSAIVTTGAAVVVEGNRIGNTVTATRVIVLPAAVAFPFGALRRLGVSQGDG